MAATIRLTVLTGPHKGNRFCFRGLDPATLGRAPECQICMCGEERDRCISRRHCELAFEPPAVRINDLDSSNGTYVNGRKSEPGMVALEEQIMAGHGDILTVGGTSLQIDIMDCPEALEGNEIKMNCPAEC
jgi:pSer/pThr/pTyr-binding forkhead associated (FHA) protein